jgi:tetrahydromethanopterin S-methyltransferase subunit G
VQAAVDNARGYAAAHQEVRRLDDVGEYTKAVDAAVGTHQASAAAAFDRLATTLRTAVEYERGAFGKDIDRARGWLTGLPIGIGVLALIAAVGVAMGVRQRLEEYR